MEKISLNIEGMACAHCIAAVTEALAALPVGEYTVWLGGAAVEFDPAATTAAQIAAAIEEQGYDVAIA
ncbi:MAG: heavy-metal-associated domain-containing protein [Oscillospiraceae bacterium]|jgi:copper chaperone CopZ|nr:heavy-metal-associated domain-containing protein [Oscillospiraceae bacterium]